MKIAFSILIFIHGLIHLLGFAKGFGLREVKELTLPISKTMGLFWLIGALFFLIFCVLYLMNHQYSWLVGMAAVITSQILIILFWQDAKFGTIPNIAVLLVSLMAFGSDNFQQLIQLETELGFL